MADGLASEVQCSTLKNMVQVNVFILLFFIDYCYNIHCHYYYSSGCAPSDCPQCFQSGRYCPSGQGLREVSRREHGIS